MPLDAHAAILERKATMKEEITVNVSSDISTRKGAFADLALVTTSDGLARLDFISRDIPSSDVSEAILTARVYMTVSNLAALRDAIDERLALNGID